MVGSAVRATLASAMADNPEGSSGQGVTSEPNTQASIAGDSPPSVSAPVRHGDELAQSALSIIEEHAKAIAPSPEEVDALQKMLTPSGQVRDACSRCFPYTSR